MEVEVKVKKLNEKAVVPTYGSPFSAGADLYACEEKAVLIEPLRTALIHTGLSFEIPENYVGLIYARSGLALKKGLAPANKVGVIDSDYRGEVMVTVYNQSDKIQKIEPFERLAQIVITPFVKADFNLVSELGKTLRGIGGFGSTGEK